MTAWTFTFTAADALTAAYAGVTAVADQLDDVSVMLPSRCAGWAVGDVLYHQLLDARRALRTFASPAAGPADTDQVSYWRHYGADSGSDARPGSPGSARHARHVRIAASAYAPDELAWDWRETSAAACRAAHACQHPAVATQGLVLATADFMSTLAVEAAVHYLDLTVALPAAPPPHPVPLMLVRWVLAGLAGVPLPGGWDDVTCALKLTGRAPLDPADRLALGELTSRIPLFG
jgi:Mycothiol maleylpyruvate isomerase N-terminal domain